MTIIRKAVFPVAGFGTRFLPATKAMPKELLPIVDKPLIQCAAEEAIAAGIDTSNFCDGPKQARDRSITLMRIMNWKPSCAPRARMRRPTWCAISFQTE